MASPEDVVIAHRSETGKHAQAIALADAAAYKHFTLHVTATPNQRGKAGWAIRRTLNAGSRRDGQDYHVRTPFTKKYRALPWPYSGCRVEADATLTGRGRVTVQILAH